MLRPQTVYGSFLSSDLRRLSAGFPYSATPAEPNNEQHATPKVSGPCFQTDSNQTPQLQRSLRGYNITQFLSITYAYPLEIKDIGELFRWVRKPYAGQHGWCWFFAILAPMVRTS
jgi:hypothetical protein